MKTKSILSNDALCLCEVYLNKLNNNSSQHVYECFLISRCSEPVKRRFYLLDIKGISYWANSVTGTLFSSSGKCMTSNSLHLNSVPVKIKKNTTNRQIKNFNIAA